MPPVVEQQRHIYDRQLASATEWQAVVWQEDMAGKYGSLWNASRQMQTVPQFVASYC